MVKNLSAMQETWFDPWVRKILWRREWLHIPVFLPGEFHGERNLVGYCPWGHKELDMTERLSLSLLSLSSACQYHAQFWCFPCGSAGKESACNEGTWVQFLCWEDPVEKGKATPPVFWPREFHGLYSPWVCKESDTTE